MTIDSQLITQIIILLALVVASAFFAGAEVVFISLSVGKVRLIKEQKDRASKLITYLKSHPQKFFVTISIWNNLINIFAASFATAVALDLFGDAGLAIATGTMTFLILVFGEIFPKVFAQKHAEGLSKIFCYPLYFFDRITTPVSWAMEKLLFAMGASHAEKISEDEIVAMVDLGTEGGELKRHEQEMIQNVLEFTDTKVEEVMVPRVEIDAIDKTKTIREARQIFEEHNHTRLPVYDGSVDKIIGFITPRNLLENIDHPEKVIEQLSLYPIVFTPASRTIRSLFQEFKSRHIHLAIVLDEHGGTQGLVTLEDLLEEIVGEIEDEQDVPMEGIKMLNNNTLEAPADIQLSDIDVKLGTNLASGEFAIKNLAFLLLAKFGKLPNRDAKIRVNDAELTVEKVSESKIERVKVEKIRGFPANSKT